MIFSSFYVFVHLVARKENIIPRGYSPFSWDMRGWWGGGAENEGHENAGQKHIVLTEITSQCSVQFF